MFLDRDDLAVTTSFECVSSIVLVAQKILKRSEQESAQAAFLLIGPAQRVLFEQMGEKTLHQVLRFSRGVSAMSQKGIKWRPICLAEIGQLLPCCFGWIRLASTQNQSPM